MYRDSMKSNFSYENLEERRLLAGDVSVVENGHLFIRGDELSNQIQIVAEESGDITVSGLNNTTINGGTDPFRVSNSVNLDGQRGRNAFFDGGLRIQTYGGNDRIDVQGIEFGGSSRIVTGEGDDFLRFIRSTGLGETHVSTDLGGDVVKLVQARTRGGFDLRTGDGDDSIRIQNSRTWSDTVVRTGSDHDHVRLNRVKFTGQEQRIATQDGNDQIEFRNNTVNESGVEIFSGQDSDQVFAEMNDDNSVLGDILFAGQGGFDILQMQMEPEILDQIQHSGFESDGVSGEVYRNAENFDRAFPSYKASAVDSLRLQAAAVSFNQDTSISSIQWQGAYFEYAALVPETDGFVIEIYENGIVDDHGQQYNAPVGEPVASFDVGNDVNRTDTGEVWEEDSFFGNNRKVFNYSAEIDFRFSADNTYWISIYTVIDDATGNDLDDIAFGWGSEEIEFVPDNDLTSTLYGGLDYWYSGEGARYKKIFSLHA